MRIAVTGAAGFIGRALCVALAKRGAGVVAISRQATEIFGTERVVQIADLNGRSALVEAFAGVEVVVHLAARVHVMRETADNPLEAFRMVNVEGTRAVCEAARRAGVRRVAYISSIKVNGEGTAVPYRESDPPLPADPYAQSKWEAEQVPTQSLSGEVTWVILRPPLVYGPGVRGNFLRLLRLSDLCGYLPLPLGHIRNRRSFVFAGNLVDAIVRSLTHPDAADRVFLVSDGEDLSTSDLLTRLARSLGGRAWLLPCPVAMSTRFAKLWGRSAEANRLLGSLIIDSSALRRDLGWVAPFSVEQGLQATADWWLGARRPGRT